MTPLYKKTPCIPAKYASKGRPCARYVHKYYLPLALRRYITPGDIDAITLWSYILSDAETPETILAGHGPGVTIGGYEKVGLTKVLKKEDVLETLRAYERYQQDSGPLAASPEEIAAAMTLNHRLIELEDRAVAECRRLIEEMEGRLQAGDLFLTDFEIELEFDFYVREDEPFFDNDEASDVDIDSDASLICQANLFGFDREWVDQPDYWGIGDRQDHNELSAFIEDKQLAKTLAAERHCYLFHDLYGHRHIP